MASSPKTFDRVSDLSSYVGQTVGVSGWLRIDQGRVDAFAEAAGDNQWIHVDVERAKNESIYGQTIVQGFLTLALAPMFVNDIFVIKNYRMKLNYGVNKVRFPSAMLVGKKIRMHLELMSYRDLGDSAETVMKYVFECQGQEKPVCVAEQINRWVF